MKSESKAAKIRVLLAEGVSVKDIAKKLKYAEPYVAQVKWHWQKKAKKNADFQKKLPKLLMQRKAKAEKKMKKIIEENRAKPTQTLGEYLRSIREDVAAQQFDKVKKLRGALDLLNEDKARDEAAMEQWYPFEEVKDMVNSPDHYTAGGIETIDFIEAKQLGYHLGNVVKYVSRAPHKGRQLEDLKKAQWYLDREIDRLEGKGFIF